MDDWQGFLTRAVLWPCCISLGKESQAASIDLLFWAAEAGCQDLCDEQNVSFQIYSCYLRHILSEYEHLTSSTYLSLVQLQFFYHFLWVHEILSALLNYFSILCLVFYVELWNSHMPENPWQFVVSTRRDRDEKGFDCIYLDKVSFHFVQQRFCWWDGNCLFEWLKII